MKDNNLFSTDTENEVLSLLLKHPTDELNLNGLRFYMFSSLVNQTIFKEIEDCRERGIIPDAITITRALESSGSLDKIGGKEYIEFLLNRTPNKENFGEHIRFIVSCYKTRNFVSLASKIKPDTINPSNVDDALQETKKEIEKLSLASGGETTMHIGSQTEETFNEILERKNHEGLRGASWGVKQIDFLSGGKIPGELWYIGGRPGQGKTAIICNSMLEDAKNNIPVLLFEREMSYQSLMERFLAIFTEIPLLNIRQGILDDKKLEKIRGALDTFKNYPIYVDTSYTLSDMYYLESTAHKYKKLHDIKVIYADYIQLLSERDEDQTQELGRISRTFKVLANDLDVCSVIVSQLNRAVEMRENKRPVLSDLRQSGNLEEDADVVVGLYRDEYYNTDTKAKNLMEFIFLKQRNGPTGTIPIRFDGETNKMGEPI